MISSPHSSRRVDGGELLAAPLMMALVIGLTMYAGVTDSFPKVFGLLVGMALLVYAVERAPEWIVAVLLVGQFLLHWLSSMAGSEISRDTPLSGPLLPMYVLCGCLVVLRVLLSHRKRARAGIAPNRPWPLAAQLVIVCALLLGFLIAAGNLYSPAPMSARAKTLGYFAFNLAPSALVLLLVDSEERLVRLVKAVIVVGTAMAVFTHLGQGAVEGGGGLYNIGEGKQGLSIGGARFTGGTWFARRLDLVLVSLLVWVALSRGVVAIVAMVVLTPYLGYLMFLSGSRGAAAGGAIALVVVLALLTMAAKSSRAIRIISVILLILVVVAASTSFREEFLAREIVERYTVLQRPFESNAAGADRLQFWQTAWSIFQDYPLFGIGSGGWGMVWNKHDYRDFPHNIFLEVLCEQGLVGALLFTLFILGAIRLVWQVIRQPQDIRNPKVLAIWAFGILTFAGLDALLSGDIQTNDYLWIAAAIGCVLSRLTAPAATREGR